MQQLLFRFASREAFLDACPPAWLGEASHPVPPPEDAALIILGALYDDPAEADGAPVPRLGYHVLGLFAAELPEAWAAAAIDRQEGDPVIPGEPPPVVPPDPGAVPLEITRAQARVAMAAYILPDGRALLTATRELLQAQLDATAALPDADPQRIAALQASEWWTAAATYRRDHPVLLQIADMLGVTASETDALFREAAQIVT